MDLDALLRRAVELGATDIHLKEGQPPILRRDGSLAPMDDAEPLLIHHLETMLNTVGSAAPARLQMFHNSGDLDIAYQAEGLPRFRVNAFRQRGSISFAFRVIPKRVPTFADLALPKGVERLTHEHRGLILCTGATGSGKTTTLAAMIGELRDAETAQTALQAAESGHLVLSTMHTVDASETMGRMIEFFPEAKQQQIRSIMAGVLRGVISQRLLPRADGGRIPAVEVMVVNARIAELIRESKTDEIGDAIEEGTYFKMQTFTAALIELVLAGRIEQEMAANAASNRHDFQIALERALKEQAVQAAQDGRENGAALPAEPPLTQPLERLRVDETLQP